METWDFHVITSLPQLLEPLVHWGVGRRAFQKQKARLFLHNLRSFGTGIHRTIDDRPYGGGDGMVIRPDILQACWESIPHVENELRIYLTPQGRLWNQSLAQRWVKEFRHWVILCGRYSGVDERFVRRWQFQEISVGNYVLSGAEPAAWIIIDTVLRLIPDTLGNPQSQVWDSFSRDEFVLEAASYTRPAQWQGLSVPPVLCTGHHQHVAVWRFWQSLWNTFHKRPDIWAQGRYQEWSSWLARWPYEFFESEDFIPKLRSHLGPRWNLFIRQALEFFGDSSKSDKA